MSLLMHFAGNRTSRRNVMVLVRFMVVLFSVITAYSVVFHLLMAAEGQSHTWITGFYWTLTVMSTLGFGDITFHTDAGRIFSIFVLLTGMVFMLTLLPFTFIEFFYAPWVAAQSALRAPRELPIEFQGHVILTHDDHVTRALIHKLIQYNYEYVMIVPELEQALVLHDEQFQVMVGDLNDPKTYEMARVQQAALVALTHSDPVNTNIASTVRGISEAVPIIALASHENSVDILQLAGCTRVLQLAEMMGSMLARRIIAGDAMAHVVGQYDQLLIAEATAANTHLVGKTLKESRLRQIVSLNVLGVWERGVFIVAQPETVITQKSVLVLTGSREQLDEYNELFCIYNASNCPVVIIGGGRIGRATGRQLKQRNVDYRIIEPLPERIRDEEHYILGSAADIDILTKAGIKTAPAVIITPHDDDINVYLTIYCRRLNPNIQIISRTTLDRNVATMHRAGADFVMSYASIGANTILNVLKRSNVLLLAEGLSMFKLTIPPSLAGKSMAETNVRKETGCTIVAYKTDGETRTNPDPTDILPVGCEIIAIGSVEAEEAFLKRFGSGKIFG